MTKKALILVDIQNDFLPGGNFAVASGNEILPLIEKLTHLPFDLIVATKDWHPGNHGSFAINYNKKTGEKIMLNGVEQTLWPVHCVQNTKGAELHEKVPQAKLSKIFYKGTDKNIDSYSAFFDNAQQKSTGLADYLNEQGIKELYLAGLTTDYCIKYSALDALKLGFKTHVIVDACRGINVHAHDSDQALNEIKCAGGNLTTYQEVSQCLVRASRPDERLKAKG
jgi:nicotinamidase/pyrazinamidase